MNKFLTNDYYKKEHKLLGSLFAIPKMKSLNGFLYQHFLYQIQGNMINHPRKVYLDINNSTYSLSLEEGDKLNDGDFNNLIKTSFSKFHEDLREYYMDNVNKHDVEMIKTFAKAIYFLKDHDKYYGYNEGKVISENLNRNYFLSIIKSFTNELISEFEWRINRLNPHNYYNYNLDDKETKKYFALIISKGIVLLNEENFIKNINEIYKKLIPKYLSEETTIEEFSKLFSGNNKIFVRHFIWIAQSNSLHYFLKELKDNSKLANKQIYKKAEELFVDVNDQKYDNLKDNHSIPNDAIELDKIIKLF